MKSILDKLMELSNDERIVGLYNAEELAEAREYGIHLAGKEEGIQETKKQVVINMLNENIDVSVISKVTGLTEDQIYEMHE